MRVATGSVEVGIAFWIFRIIFCQAAEGDTEKDSETEPFVPATLNCDDAGAMHAGDREHEMGNA